jgi:hypothetical protein
MRKPYLRMERQVWNVFQPLHLAGRASALGLKQLLANGRYGVTKLLTMKFRLKW